MSDPSKLLREWAAALSVQAMMQVLTQQAIQHPPPWRVEYDWTNEVIASDGYCIAKCSDPDVAKSLVVWAEQHKKELDEFEKNFEKEYMS